LYELNIIHLNISLISYQMFQLYFRSALKLHIKCNLQNLDS